MRCNQGPDVEAFHGQKGKNKAGLVLGNRFYTYLSEELNLAGREAGRQAFVGQKKNKIKALCCGNVLHSRIKPSQECRPKAIRGSVPFCFTQFVERGKNTPTFL